jgi:hypothetical protein
MLCWSDPMRIVVVFCLVTAVSGALGPSSMELRNRYGTPNMERFTARPGIDVTVEYGADRLACDVSIGPSRPLIDEHPLAMEQQLISSESVSEILEEVAPVAIRGKQITDGSFQSSCAVWRSMEYENVVIGHSLTACVHSGQDKEFGATVSFHRDACPKRPPTMTIVK